MNQTWEQIVRKKSTMISEKINEPCWFFNNGGCKKKDGSIKPAKECKYLHVYSNEAKRPTHLYTKKMYDKFSFKNDPEILRQPMECVLGKEEWNKLMPAYINKNIMEKQLMIETKLTEIEYRLRILEFQQGGIGKDILELTNKISKIIENDNLKT